MSPILPGIALDSNGMEEGTMMMAGGLPHANTALFQGTDYEKISSTVRAVHALRKGSLKDLWASSMNTPLPELKVVIAGDQSHGKSTLVERLTEIPMLRGGGTCTKCPTEIRLMTSKDTTLGPAATAAGPAGAGAAAAGAAPSYMIKIQVWDKASNTFEPEEPFMTGVQRADVAQMIREAQETVLSAGNPEGMPLKISKGLVIVEVSNAPVDLTLVDLPGIIANDADPQVVRDIEDLTLEYTRKPGCLFVAVMAASADISNSNTLRLLTQSSPPPSTIGGMGGGNFDDENDGIQLRYAVVTSLDKVTSPSVWEPLLCGHDDRHIHIPAAKWFAVKNPDLAQGHTAMLGLDYEDAIKEEQDFFDSSNFGGEQVRQLLHNLRSSPARERCGIRALRMALSNGLNQLMRSQLSTFMAEVEHMRECVAKEEEKLGQEAAHAESPAEYVRTLLHKVETRLTYAVSSMGEIKTFGPTFHTVTHQIYQGFVQEVLSYRPKFDNPRTSAAALVDPRTITPELLAQYPTPANIRAALSNLTNGMPLGEGDKEILVLNTAPAWAAKLWPKHTKLCLNRLAGVLLEEARKCLDTEMDSSYPELKDTVLLSLKDWLDVCCAEAEDQLDRLTDMEVCFLGTRGQPFTALQDIWSQFAQEVTLAAVNSGDSTDDRKVIAVQRALAAHFEVFSRRYIDTALLIVRYHLVRNFAVGFYRGVFSRLCIKAAGDTAAAATTKAVDGGIAGGADGQQPQPQYLVKDLQALVSCPTRKKLREVEEKLVRMNMEGCDNKLKAYTMDMFTQKGSLRAKRLEQVKATAARLKEVATVLGVVCNDVGWIMV